jgi:two-component system chemotaxis sensor kinase CheA
VSDLVLARNALARRLRDIAAGAEADSAFERLSAFVGEMHEAVSRTRMQRLETLFAPLPRFVRDLVRDSGKDVTLELQGGDVELDRELIEIIRDPLTHLVRNAIDHGIESGSARIAAGKPSEARLRIEARQAGNQIVVEVSDDGRGIDPDAVASKAVASGAVTAERAKAMSRAARTALIFQPGLSTAEAASDLSGRGVGLDIVRANVERIGGRIEVRSEPGQGTCFALRVPLTLSIMPGLIVETGGQTFAIPRSAIEEIVRGSAVQVEHLGGAAVATVRGRRFPVLTIEQLTRGPAASADSPRFLVLLKTIAGGFFALAVEAVHDHEELVVKPASPAVGATGLYAGTTLSDEGSPILLLDPTGIAAHAGVIAGPTAPEAPAEQTATRRPPALLFTSLCGARRAVPLGAVERIEEVPAGAVHRSAGRLHVTLGTRILPLAGCSTLPASETLKILRLGDGAAELAYAALAVAETAEMPPTWTPPPEPGELAGVALVGGEPTELLDLHWLFASFGTSSGPRVRARCVIAGDGAWAEAFLRPLVESAGYDVTLTAHGGSGPVDLVILVDDDESVPDNLGRVLKLRRTPEPRSKSDESIHCYDRAAILGALAAMGG